MEGSNDERKKMDPETLDLQDQITGKGNQMESSKKTTSIQVGILKETSHSILNSVNKNTCQFKKPSHRKSISPLNWFPRKKTDSFLKRKIRHLQEVDGMNSTLDEALCHANPHYSRVEKEKIAVREAASKAMEARKAAMVEASWCRILRAARIQSKEAESMLMQAEKCVVEAFETARALGVMMYDQANSSRQTHKIKASSITRRSTHTIRATFETAFEVDKEVAAAVKVALIKLVNCPSRKDELHDLLTKISQNPEINDTTFEYESDSTLHSSSDEICTGKLFKTFESTTPKLLGGLVDVMYERLERLQDEDLTSLATIVATCGLNKALREGENDKQNDRNSSFDFTLNPYYKDEKATKALGEIDIPSLDKFLVKHMSALEKEVLEAKITSKNKPAKETKSEREDSASLPGLDSVLVKHLSRLEMDVQNAKIKGKDPALEYVKKKSTDQNAIETPSLEEILVKHVGRLEREVQEAKNRGKDGKLIYIDKKYRDQNDESERLLREEPLEHSQREDSCGNPVSTESNHSESFSSDFIDDKSLDKENIDSNTYREPLVYENVTHTDRNFIEGIPPRVIKQNGVDTQSGKYPSGKYMSRIERAKIESLEAFASQSGDNSLGGILVKPVHRLQREKERKEMVGRVQNKQETEDKASTFESLDKVLVKHVPRLAREKLTWQGWEINSEKTKGSQSEMEQGLNEVLHKHRSSLEKEKISASHVLEDKAKPFESRREAKEREMQEAWGGLGLGNSLKPHLSRLEREKAAWIEAEKEERVKAREKTE